MNIRNSLCAVLGGVLTVSAVPSQANALDNPHRGLLNALHDAGIEVQINEKRDCLNGINGQRVAGFYAGGLNYIAICQDNARAWNGRNYGWTASDLDTLRHEAHHVVQDCLDGRKDGRMVPLFNTRERMTAFLSRYDTRKIERIIEVYSEQGNNDHRVLLEIEAFAVAEMVRPGTIGEAVTKHCM